MKILKFLIYSFAEHFLLFLLFIKDLFSDKNKYN